ncbi:MAG TPA: hypothetical protein PLZ78_09035 [Spirochaetota bacterium]|nr:hypothetical protein [Spirochaetota bacterium]
MSNKLKEIDKCLAELENNESYYVRLAKDLLKEYREMVEKCTNSSCICEGRKP